jgi:hypothetical protein
VKNDREERTGWWLGLGMVAGLAGIFLLRSRRPVEWKGDEGWALITGASSGIGAAFAHRLAAEGHDLILVARRRERLEELAGELQARRGVTVEVLPADLLVEEGVAAVTKRVEEEPDLALLINNAGFGTGGPFVASEIETEVDMVRLHDIVALRLTRAALPGMVGRGGGGVINLSSVASFWPLPGSATYSASKVFLNNFSEAVHQEVVERGVHIQALCPGFTRTEFHETNDVAASGIPSPLWLSTDQVVEESLRDLRRGKVISVPSWRYRFVAGLANVVPLGLLRVIGGLFQRLRRGERA